VHLPKDPKCNQYAEVVREQEQESGTHLGVFRTARKEVAAYGQCRRSEYLYSEAHPILWLPSVEPRYKKKNAKSLLGALPFICASHLPQRARDDARANMQLRFDATL
jgi:hypothetical protein